MSTWRPACVVGGGPAGLAAAIALRQAGASVSVFDHAHPPQDKTCGEGLLPGTLDALSQLGVRIPPGCGYPFRGIRFIDSRYSVAADFPRGTALGLRRPVLHTLLLERAQQLGVEFHWDAKQLPRVDGRILIAADGLNSRLRRERGLDAVNHERRRYGFRRHYRTAPRSSYMELYWGCDCQVYVTPVACDEVCVVAMASDPHLRVNEALAQFPELEQRLAGAPVSSRDTGAPSTSRKFKRVSGPNFALIGDASGSVDAITGEGLGLAFKQALALTEALKRGNLREYEEEHARLSRRPRRMSGLLLLLDRHPSLRKLLLAAFAAHPTFFASLLALHTGARTVEI